MPESATACNCTICRRYGALWIYGYEGHGVDVSGATHAHWRGLKAEEDGRRRLAVNLRLTEPGPVANIPIDHFDGLDKFEDLPRDGRCVGDYWF